MSMKKRTKGDQFVNKVDMNKICIDFITFYYTTLQNNCDELLNSPLWKPYTKMNIDGMSCNFDLIVKFHKNLVGSNIEIISHQFVPDGSRRLDIMVKGKITKNYENKMFVQSFALIEYKKTFFIKLIQFYFI